MKANLSRRDFTRLSAAAFGGMIAGTFGCQKGDRQTAENTNDAKPNGDQASGAGSDKPVEQPGVEYDEALLTQEPHVCRGLNSCKNKGACKTLTNECKGKNACAGQGGCATAAKHDCNGFNECKGQGGCGERPGENSCKQKGACAVPLTDKTWTKARANFEAAMQKAGKEVGAAPTIPKAPGA